MKGCMLRVGVLLLAVALCLPSVPSAAQEGRDDEAATHTDAPMTPGAEIGLGAASFLVTIPYGAVKLSVSLLGGVVGGFAYLLSGFNQHVAEQIWYTAMPGDYVITPEHLTGKRGLRFTGVPPERHPREGA